MSDPTATIEDIMATPLTQEHLRALTPYKDAPTAKFPVIEVFGPTIQGEGMMIGEKTLFVRMGGCDYRCAKCDSLHAVIPEAVKKNARWLSTQEILEALGDLATPEMCPWITLSGGNPVMWDLSELVTSLREIGYKVAVETQGSLWRDWLMQVDVLTICPKGPGMGERFSPVKFIDFIFRVEEGYERLMGRMAVCIKHVIFDQRDFEFAVSLDEILDARNHGLGIFWPKEDRYLSLGNPYPPVLLADLTLDTSGISAHGEFMYSLVEQLLINYRTLLEDYLNDQRISHWKFLPQLHVLIYGNKAAV